MDKLWLLIAVAITVILLAVVAVIVNRRKSYKPDYYTFFIMGIIWLPAGIAMGNIPLMIMGLVFIAVGLLNKNKWKKNHKTWKSLTKKEKKLRLILLIVVVILFLLGVTFFYLVEYGLI